MYHTEQHTTEPTRELREEYARMQKRMARLTQSVTNTTPKRQPAYLRDEIEMLRANLAALARRYRFD